MWIRWIGAAMILAAGGGFGFMMAHNHRREEKLLQDLISVIDFLSAELACRLTPLPQLCILGSEQVSGIIRCVFLRLGEELNRQIAPDAESCMRCVLERTSGLSDCICSNLMYLGRNLGKFDLESQLVGLSTAEQMCRRELDRMERNKDVRLRNYQVLGLCAGAALVILLI